MDNDALKDLLKLRTTLRSWTNWSKPTDLLGLLLGLGDYMQEISLIERELGLRESKLSEYANVLEWDAQLSKHDDHEYDLA